MSTTTHTLCYLGLGSNLNGPKQQIMTAIRYLSHLPTCNLLKLSSLYRSKPLVSKRLADDSEAFCYAPEHQPDYYNAAVALETSMPPEALLKTIKDIETCMGRLHQEGIWGGARIIDIDILLFGSLTLTSATLKVPHPEIAHRPFVVLPLLELNPGLNFPDGTPLERVAESLEPSDIQIEWMDLSLEELYLTRAY